MDFKKRLQYMKGLIKYCKFQAKKEFILWYAFTPSKTKLLQVTGLFLNFIVVWYVFLK